MSTSLIDECYRRAADARRLAKAASMPSNKVNFLGMEQRWLLAARSVTAKSSFSGQASEPAAQQTILNRAVAQQTVQLEDSKSKPPPPKGRPTKFTPERIQQIKNLVAEAKSREEIAELIEVTVGSLQVTCSKLGISLRRPRLDNGICLIPRGKPVPSNGRSTSDPSCDVSVPLQPIGEGSRQDSQPGPPERTWHTTRHQQRPKAKEADLANLTLTMHYKGEGRTTKLALTPLAIGQLALEAELRDMRIGEFVSELVTETIQKSLFQRVLDIS
jgi:hypothetical protein